MGDRSLIERLEGEGRGSQVRPKPEQRLSSESTWSGGENHSGVGEIHIVSCAQALVEAECPRAVLLPACGSHMGLIGLITPREKLNVHIKV